MCGLNPNQSLQIIHCSGFVLVLELNKLEKRQNRKIKERKNDLKNMANQIWKVKEESPLILSYKAHNGRQPEHKG